MTISRRERRTLTAGMVVLVAIWSLGRGLPLWKGRFEARQLAADEARQQLIEYQSLIVRQADIEQALAQASARFVGLAPQLVDGRTPAAAAGALASILSTTAEQSGLSVSTTQATADTSRSAAFTRLTASLSATGDIRALARLLARIEAGPQLLAIRELSIDQSDPAAPATQPEVLRIQLKVQALRLATFAERR